MGVRWEWGVVRMALEMVPTSVNMLDNDTPRGTVEHTRDGVLKRISSCSRCGSPSKAKAAKQGVC